MKTLGTRSQARDALLGKSPPRCPASPARPPVCSASLSAWRHRVFPGRRPLLIGANGTYSAANNISPFFSSPIPGSRGQQLLSNSPEICSAPSVCAETPQLNAARNANRPSPGSPCTKIKVLEEDRLRSLPARVGCAFIVLLQRRAQDWKEEGHKITLNFGVQIFAFHVNFR